MLDFQKEWIQSYPEIVHLDGTYDTNNEKYVLHTFLVQVKFNKKSKNLIENFFNFN